MKNYTYGSTQVCRVCAHEQDIEQFYRKDPRTERRSTRCKRCQIASQREKSLGISEAQYRQILADQHGACAICGMLESDPKLQRQILAVDHNHKTGQIRGLLCGNCNTAIGLFKDDANRMRDAIFYLDNHQEYPIYVPQP